VLNLLAKELVEAAPPGVADGESELGFDQICEAVARMARQVNGSYSIVTLIAGKGLLAFRDPNGIRPLIWGRRVNRREGDGQVVPGFSHAHMVASESVAVSFNGFEVERSLEP